MKILLVAATANEIEPFKSFSSDRHVIDFLVSGAGMVATTYSLTRHLNKATYDVIINLGVAGSFDRSIKIGEVVCVKQDIFSELGAEDNESFLTINDMGLEGNAIFHYKPEEEFTQLNKFRKVISITVNTVHGNEKSIASVVKRFNPEIETMEGAAFFYVCEKEKVHGIQLRSVSNYVEKRNRDAWNIPLALRSLKEAVENFIAEI